MRETLQLQENISSRCADNAPWNVRNNVHPLRSGTDTNHKDGLDYNPQVQKAEKSTIGGPGKQRWRRHIKQWTNTTQWSEEDKKIRTKQYTLFSCSGGWSEKRLYSLMSILYLIAAVPSLFFLHPKNVNQYQNHFNYHKYLTGIIKIFKYYSSLI